MAEKKYLNINVYQALQQRLDYVFSEFDNIWVSFSGGKDSGVLLNLVITETTNYVDRTMAANHDLIEPYWICLPIKDILEVI
jgi:predicted phosphoadenosine phosphosulfate sulfurtransferase